MQQCTSTVPVWDKCRLFLIFCFLQTNKYKDEIGVQFQAYCYRAHCSLSAQSASQLLESDPFVHSDFGNSNNFNQNTNYLILIINASDAPVIDLIKVNISKLHHKAFFNISGMSSRYSNCTNRGKEGRKGREGKCIF